MHSSARFWQEIAARTAAFREKPMSDSCCTSTRSGSIVPPARASTRKIGRRSTLAMPKMCIPDIHIPAWPICDGPALSRSRVQSSCV